MRVRMSCPGTIFISSLSALLVRASVRSDNSISPVARSPPRSLPRSEALPPSPALSPSPSAPVCPRTGSTTHRSRPPRVPCSQHVPLLVHHHRFQLPGSQPQAQHPPAAFSAVHSIHQPLHSVLSGSLPRFLLACQLPSLLDPPLSLFARLPLSSLLRLYSPSSLHGRRQWYRHDPLRQQPQRPRGEA
ncbi:hypothetical protein OH77DRAFT_1320016 [Trametes cingulata]|nr:hypothetical protein OH77DRAFT_1320016 [Trametes cingulata]